VALKLQLQGMAMITIAVVAFALFWFISQSFGFAIGLVSSLIWTIGMVWADYFFGDDCTFDWE
jgi:hypothetical protein